MGSIEERAHRNFCDYTRWLSRLHADAALIDESGVVALAGPTDFPTARTALRSDPTLSVEKWADIVDPFFAERGVPGRQNYQTPGAFSDAAKKQPRCERSGSRR